MSDYVKMEDVLSLADDYEIKMPDDEILFNYIAVEDVIELPAADVVERKRGRWKPFDLTWGRNVYACTACGDAFEVPCEMGIPIFKFCPNCGARMIIE